MRATTLSTLLVTPLATLTTSTVATVTTTMRPVHIQIRLEKLMSLTSGQMPIKRTIGMMNSPKIRTASVARGQDRRRPLLSTTRIALKALI